jgi:hypothetical protein
VFKDGLSKGPCPLSCTDNQESPVITPPLTDEMKEEMEAYRFNYEQKAIKREEEENERPADALNFKDKENGHNENPARENNLYKRQQGSE